MRHTLLTPEQAAAVMHDGGVIAYPTEAVFGLGCDPHNEKAVRRILALKQRAESMGLILIGSDFTQFSGWVGDANPEPALATWPGPVTWLFPKAADAPHFITGDHPTQALRVTAHEGCRALCDAFGGPVVSTSANPHGTPPARSAGEVETYFGDFIDGIVAGALGGKDNCSEIRDLATGKILRPA
ncbi:tRNA threonylcarbamoyladenosine biosynthesis protein RimN [Marinihelvus fidelis]|uniref:Threonylcarbamoyl-AMP synthase n=1 Tax=Marinihelvus fidelis TaxID=2613842 RepID=A0A5N0T9B8_9GAMM|nr:Sua5/YciO/YrdC/YwlC family protein [Marinihelvus fidelis]KAA9131318.1 tRNA threonylcarbamoyladenosine biosynthesis protein RimN [Marinihelvus fidelis]